MKFEAIVYVLANIYNDGLKQISSSSTPSQCGAILPMHYVYGWLGNYFDIYLASSHSHPGVRMVKLAGKKMAKRFTTVSACNLLRSVDPSKLSSLALLESDELTMEDDGVQSQSWIDYTISLCSCYLTFRRNSEYIIEPYSPHRFLRQFNFCQDVPGKFVGEACPLNLSNVVKSWQSCMNLGTGAKLKIPARSHKGLVTKQYQEWWMKYASDLVKGEAESTVKQIIPE